MKEQLCLYKVTPSTFNPFYVAATDQGNAVGKLYAYLSEVNPQGSDWHDTQKYNVQYVDHLVF